MNAVSRAHARSASSSGVRDAASVAFLLAVVANTALLATSRPLLVEVPLAVVQAFLLLGCQEAKHLASHRAFVSARGMNGFAGHLFAGLVGQNFTAFKHFHFAHHRAPCTEGDPEGRLYALSWNTRWIWALAPLEMAWVAVHLNRAGAALVPPDRRAALRRSRLAGWLCAAALAWAAWKAPHAFAWAYAIPSILAAWIDFPLTQAEHYGVAVASAGTRRRPEAVTLDVALPIGLGWPMLHRSLHRVHHAQPSASWVSAPLRISGPPRGYAAFVRHWLDDGPRRWLPAAEAQVRSTGARS